MTEDKINAVFFVCSSFIIINVHADILSERQTQLTLSLRRTHTHKEKINILKTRNFSRFQTHFRCDVHGRIKMNIVAEQTPIF